MASATTQIASPTDQAFSLFYDQYAPSLWGLLVSAHLPSLQADVIFINTMTRLWQEMTGLACKPKYVYARLVGIACQEGFPDACLAEALRLHQRLGSDGLESTNPAAVITDQINLQRH